MRRPSLSTICSFVAVAAAVLFVFLALRPGLLFLNTTPSGGDMGSHVWGPAFIRDHLLHHGRITGWSPDWYAGFPAFTFYFPLPSLVIVLLNVVLPYGVAFKLVTVIGLLALPVCAWGFGKLMRFDGAIPACLAVLTVPYLFERSYTIYGGNIASTLAGEFSFSISLALALLFLGVFNRALETGKGRATAAVLLAATGLCHFIPTFFAAGGALVLFALHLDKRRLKVAATILGVGALLGAFWWLPFLMRLPYTTDMGWERLTTYRAALFPVSLYAPLALGLIGLGYSFVFRRRGGIYLGLLAGGSVLAFLFAPQSRLWNARLLPFWFLSVYLLAGVGVAAIGQGFAALVAYAARKPEELSVDHMPSLVPLTAETGFGNGHGWIEVDDVDHVPNGHENGDGAHEDGPAVAQRWLNSLTPVAACALFLLITALPLHPTILNSFPIKTADSSFIPGWIKWNYTGYERKPAHPEYADVVATMAKVGKEHGCGRTSWEYESELDRFGTPMALMLLPYWTHGCIGSMEGLYFESSATTPYHFLSNSELSLRPPRPQRDLPYRDLDVTKGVQHLQLMGVRYYLAISDAAQAQANQNPDLTLIAKSQPWTATITEPGKSAESKTRRWAVYEVAGSADVAPLSYEPVVMTGVPKGGKEWQAASVKWFQGDPTRWQVPLAASGPKSWARVKNADSAVPRKPVAPVKVSHLKMSDDRISFDVDHVGRPVLIKASYFPNWQVSGASKVYRVTPNQMVVIPTSKHVSLHYGTTPVDYAGWLMTLGGVACLVLLVRAARRRGNGADPVSPARAAVEATGDPAPVMSGEYDVAPRSATPAVR
jgi:hypothetical protein